MDFDKTFNTSGKFATDSEFWKDFSHDVIDEMGITDGFRKVLGEQVFRPLGDVRTPFYNKFAGRPLLEGTGWTERALYKTKGNHFKPKATAQDDLGFVDSRGVEISYKVDISGWIKATVPSDLETIEMMLKRGAIGELSNRIVDNVIKTYQSDMESLIAKKTVSNIKHSAGIDFTDGVNAWKTINRYAIEFMGESVHYNLLTDEMNDNLRKLSSTVYCFIDAITYENMVSSFASLPSPDYINKYVEYIPLYDGCPTPLTTAEFNENKTDEYGTTVTWDTMPIAIDQPKPTAILISADAVEYRPLINSYKLNISRNGAGDFENTHLIYKGALKAVSPFSDCLRLNQIE